LPPCPLLRSDPGSAIANYWLVVGARGAGDLDRAWDAAVAGWIRAGLGPDTQGLRAELDHLVLEALVPERVRRHATPERPDPRAAMRAEWEAMKAEWRKE